MADQEIPQDAVWRATYGLRYKAEQQGLNLHGYDVEALARNTLHHALASGQIVLREDHDRQLAEAREDGEAAKRRWSAAHADVDRTLVRLKGGVVDLLAGLGQELLDQAEKIDKGGMPSRKDD